MQKKGTMEKQKITTRTQSLLSPVTSVTWNCSEWQSLKLNLSSVLLSPGQRSFSLQSMVMTTDSQLIHLQRIRTPECSAPFPQGSEIYVERGPTDYRSQRWWMMSENRVLQTEWGGGHVTSQTVTAWQDHISSSQTESQLGAGEVGTKSHASWGAAGMWLCWGRGGRARLPQRGDTWCTDHPQGRPQAQLWSVHTKWAKGDRGERGTHRVWSWVSREVGTPGI